MWQGLAAGFILFLPLAVSARETAVEGSDSIRMTYEAPRAKAEPTKIYRLNAEPMPGFIAGGYFDSASDSILPVRIKSSAELRSSPSAKAKNLGTVGDRLRDGQVLLTNQVKDGWVEVVAGTEMGWVQASAMTDLPESLQSGAPREKTEMEKPTKSNAESTKSKPCVSNFSEFRRNERLQRAMAGSNPFTTWTGPMGANLEVSESGRAILNHPSKGQIPLSLSLCVDEGNRPYIRVMGQTLYFEGADFSRVSVKDPESGQRYDFNKASQ